MKFKLKAGMDIDLLNRDELADELGRMPAWVSELGRGVKYVDLSRPTVSDGTGAWSVTFQPGNGFLWSVTRIAVSGAGYDPTADSFAIFNGQSSGLRLVENGLARVGKYDLAQLVVKGPAELIVSGTNANASAEVLVSGAAVEVPAAYGWKLLG